MSADNEFQRKSDDHIRQMRDDHSRRELIRDQKLAKKLGGYDDVERFKQEHPTAFGIGTGNPLMEASQEGFADQVIAANDHARLLVEAHCRNNVDAQIANEIFEYDDDGLLRKLVEDAVAAYLAEPFSLSPIDEPFGITHNRPPDDRDPDTGVVALIAGMPNQRWPIHSQQTFGSVLEIARRETWCDLHFSKAKCVTRMQHSKRDLEAGTIAESDYLFPLTLPFPYGNFIVIVLSCKECFAVLVKPMPE